MNDAKEEIRERLAIEDVVGEYLELKRSGRNYKGLSPFNNEKTPSFMVSPDKKIWHDFSSGKGGDIFTFVMEMEGFDFPKALEFLARKAGVELKQYSSAQSQKLAERKKTESAIYQLATRFYQACLGKSKLAMAYAEKRHLSAATIAEFMIGYSPNLKSALVDFLGKKNFSKKMVVAAGLTNQYGGDLFRGRLMIPLSDQNGQVIGYTGRGLEADSVPKYLNTPSTLLYDKSRHIFALYQAKEAIRKTNQAVMVEGNMDAISSHQAGVKNVVATAGTAMTANHLKTLSRFASDIRLSFDGDDAGVRATERAIELAQGLNIDLKIISMPASAKDPDELINQGVELWRAAIAQAVPAVDWLIAQYAKRCDLETVQGKRDFSRIIMAVVKKLSDPVEREAYTKRVAEKLDISIEALLKQTEITTNVPKKLRRHQATSVEADEFIYQDDLLALCVLSADARLALAELGAEQLSSAERQALAEFFIKQAQNNHKLEAKDLPKQAIRAKVLMLRAEEQYQNWTLSDIKQQVKYLINRIKIDNQKQQYKKLTADLRQAEEVGDDQLVNKLRLELNEIIKRKQS